MKIKALIRQEQSAGYSVSVPALPGCHSEGETREEALANIKEAAELWMEVTTTAWDRVLQYSDEPQAAAKYLLKLRFSAADRRRITELAAKARAGTLTADEKVEADTFERLGCMLDILHSNARRMTNLLHK